VVHAALHLEALLLALDVLPGDLLDVGLELMQLLALDAAPAEK